MKPLVNVTRQDDELRAIEVELKTVNDKLARSDRDVDSLRNLVDTLTMEKSKLNEQLISEQDMLNEAEEVSYVLSVGRSVAG